MKGLFRTYFDDGWYLPYVSNVETYSAESYPGSAESYSGLAESTATGSSVTYYIKKDGTATQTSCILEAQPCGKLSDLKDALEDGNSVTLLKGSTYTATDISLSITKEITIMGVDSDVSVRIDGSIFTIASAVTTDSKIGCMSCIVPDNGGTFLVHEGKGLVTLTQISFKPSGSQSIIPQSLISFSTGSLTLYVVSASCIGSAVQGTFLTGTIAKDQTLTLTSCSLNTTSTKEGGAVYLDISTSTSKLFIIGCNMEDSSGQYGDSLFVQCKNFDIATDLSTWKNVDFSSLIAFASYTSGSKTY